VNHGWRGSMVGRLFSRSGGIKGWENAFRAMLRPFIVAFASRHGKYAVPRTQKAGTHFGKKNGKELPERSIQ